MHSTIRCTPAAKAGLTGETQSLERLVAEASPFVRPLVRSTMRKKLLLLGSLILAVMLLGVMLLWWTAPGAAISLEGYKQLQFGMTKSDVEEILGPAGDHSMGKLEFDQAGVGPARVDLEWAKTIGATRIQKMVMEQYAWRGNNGYIAVRLYDGEVRWIYFMPGSIRSVDAWKFLRRICRVAD